MHTKEQQEILEFFQQDNHEEILLVAAVAGSGKTYLSKEIVKQLKPRKGLYTAFNKAIVTEGVDRFRGYSIECKTLHALAYRYVKPNQEIHDFSYYDIKEKVSYNDKAKILEVFNQFTVSASVDAEDYFSRHLSTKLAVLANKYLDKMVEGKMPITFNFLLKYFHLLLDQQLIECSYDIVILDEINDTTAVALEIFKLIQSPKKLGLGEPCIAKGTRVLTDTGWRKIESIIRSLEKNENVNLKSYDVKTDTFSYKKASNPIRQGKKEVLKIKGNKTSLRVTRNHKILTVNGYVKAENLKIGDLLLKYKNKAKNGYSFNLNSVQKDVLVGSFLGDGSIQKITENGFTYRLGLGHSVKQKNYLLWKFAPFGVTSSNLIMVEERKNIILGKEINCRQFYYATTKSFQTKIKLDLDFCIENINTLSLAIWLMDDGSIKSRSKKTGKIQGITISSNSFNKEENLKLIKTIKSKFSIDCVLGKDKNFYEINFRTEESQKLLELVKEYIHTDFKGKFKTNDDKVKELPLIENNYIVDSVVDIHPDGIDETFDLEVEDNHNMIASNVSQKEEHTGVVIHNCQAIYNFLNLEDGFKELSDYPIKRLTKSFRCSSTIAKKIEKFVNRFERAYVFTGNDSPTPNGRSLHVTMTNASIIHQIIDYLAKDTGFTLLREPKEIFAYPMALLTAGGGKKVYQRKYRFLEEEYNNFLDRTDMKENWLQFIYRVVADQETKSAVNLLGTLKTKNINLFDLYKQTNDRRQGIENTIATVFTSKGLEFENVYIDDDMNYAVSKVFKDFDPDNIGHITTLRCYYVACSRTQLNLVNAKHLPK